MSKASSLSPIPMQLPNQLILDTGPLVLLALSWFYEQTSSAASLALKDGLASNYTLEQSESLESLLKRAHRVLLSPYCLAESTNLIKSRNQRLALAEIAGALEPCRENSIGILQHPKLLQLGVADVSLLLLAQTPRTYTLTADGDLFEALCSADCTAVYFCVKQDQQYIVSYPE